MPRELTVDDVRRRVAAALAEAEMPELRHHWASEFFAAMHAGFIPAGRINSASGTDIRATLINCFVQPVSDSVSEDVDGKPSIYKTLAQAAETMRRGGGVGYDFSRIRTKGAFVKGTHSNASSPARPSSRQDLAVARRWASCGEQSLPDYGCSCLGSIDLTRFVVDPFTAGARFDGDGLRAVVRTAVRMLDNVLDVTYWPLPEQHREARSKRRVGLGFLGLGSALVMLCIRYSSDEACCFGAEVAQCLRDEAYRASIKLAQEKGAFPALMAERYLESGFAQRLPDAIRTGIRRRGIRNSHLLSIAPTGTIALAFADNASNGIEPAFSWTYRRKKRMADGSVTRYEVDDRAYRLYREGGGDVEHLPAYFMSAMDLTAAEHLQMLVSVQPFIDSSISKTVNVPPERARLMSELRAVQGRVANAPAATASTLTIARKCKNISLPTSGLSGSSLRTFIEYVFVWRRCNHPTASTQHKHRHSTSSTPD